MLILIVLAVVPELVMYQKTIWAVRKPLAGVIIVALPALSGMLLASKPNLMTVTFLLLSFMRVFNMLRLVEGRIKEQHLYRSALRASFSFIALQLVLALLMLLPLRYNVMHLLLLFGGSQLLAAGILLLSVVRGLQKSLPDPAIQHYADRELPTVSVLIPARNETEDLEACLHSLLASNYPKLEIIVLDDCSHDRTPEIIRSFAHDGVRFISGEEPDQTWLAKNYAYQRLAEAATGEVLLFCGVDTRFGGNTIWALVTIMLDKQKQMISVMPRRMVPAPHAAFIQPMRYWWELALPRRYFNRPPVLSTCWLITRKALDDAGGFASSKHAIIPEMLFARALVRTDAYSFIRAGGVIELETRKSWQEQRDTAIRLRYPQIHRRPELAFLLAATELLFLFGPFVTVVTGLFLHNALVAVLSALAIFLLIIAHLRIMAATDPSNVPLALVNFPVVALSEIALGLVSMCKYEFSVVEWKGRNISLPVMHVEPHLPSLK